ncbi:MAG: chemotaxis protein CheB [Hyphomicrobiales bacterium]
MPVGVGASAGGLEALKALLPTSPSDDSLAFDIVVHLRPGQPSVRKSFPNRSRARPPPTASCRLRRRL